MVRQAGSGDLSTGKNRSVKQGTGGFEVRRAEEWGVCSNVESFQRSMKLALNSVAGLHGEEGQQGCEAGVSMAGKEEQGNGAPHTGGGPWKRLDKEGEAGH